MEREFNDKEFVLDDELIKEAELKDGVIYKLEKREPLNKMKTWYKEKVIDSGLSSKIEGMIDLNTKIQKGIVGVVGTGASIALTICPADGPFGEAATILATPAIMKLFSIQADMEKKALLFVKRTAEKAMGFENQDYNKEKVDQKINIDDIKKGLLSVKEITDNYSAEKENPTKGRGLL